MAKAMYFFNSEEVGSLYNFRVDTCAAHDNIKEVLAMRKAIIARLQEIDEEEDANWNKRLLRDNNWADFVRQVDAKWGVTTDARSFMQVCPLDRMDTTICVFQDADSTFSALWFNISIQRMEDFYTP